ncbi:MAG: chromate transporter, partial [Actinomycetota bacterium]|nr:chromate transporter [Actinomycetota bacterium]
MTAPPGAERVPLRTVALEWGKIGVTGFGGPPAHIELLRALLVERQGWIAERELEDAIAACNILPRPASTQLAIFCARRLAGWPGAVIGGLAFVVPAVVLILALSMLFLAHAPPAWVRGAGAGAGAAVAAVAVRAGGALLRPSWNRAGVGLRDRDPDGPGGSDADRFRDRGLGDRARWSLYVGLGAAAAALAGPYLVLVLLVCGAAELTVRSRTGVAQLFSLPTPALATLIAGGLPAVGWVAFKVGALSYGGGFVIVPLMQGDAHAERHRS